MNARRAVAGGLLVAALGAGAACSKPGHGLIILCAGDSLTEQGYPRPLRAALRADGVRARVLNYGRSGNTSAEYLAFLQANADRLRGERPDIVLVQLGTNDVRADGDRVGAAEFARNLREIVGIFRDFRSRSGVAPAVYVGTVPPVPEGTPYPFGADSPGRITSEINPAVRMICEDSGAGFVDNYRVFAGRPDLLPGIHPSAEGYRALAESWYGAFRGPARRPGN